MTGADEHGLEEVAAEVRELATQLSELRLDVLALARTLETISNGFFYLNLHLGADVGPWLPPDSRRARAHTNAPASPSAPQMSSPQVGSLATGRVKWFDAIQGFGFLVADQGGDDVFVHSSSIQVSGYSALHEGQRVEFTIVPGPKGPMAENVRTV